MRRLLHAGYLSADRQLTVNRCIDQLLLSEYMSCIDRRTGYTLVTCWWQWCCFASVGNASVDALVVSQLACWLTQQWFFSRVHDLLVTCWPMRWQMRWWDQIHYDTRKGTKWNLRKMDPPSLHQLPLGMEGGKVWSRKCWKINTEKHWGIIFPLSQHHFTDYILTVLCYKWKHKEICQQSTHTNWIFLSILCGRLKRNLNLCRTLSAFLVLSASSLRAKTSWNNPSAFLLAPDP